jgi:hypothetical protein
MEKCWSNSATSVRSASQQSPISYTEMVISSVTYDLAINLPGSEPFPGEIFREMVPCSNVARTW